MPGGVNAVMCCPLLNPSNAWVSKVLGGGVATLPALMLAGARTVALPMSRAGRHTRTTPRARESCECGYHVPRSMVIGVCVGGGRPRTRAERENGVRMSAHDTRASQASAGSLRSAKSTVGTKGQQPTTGTHWVDGDLVLRRRLPTARVRGAQTVHVVNTERRRVVCGAGHGRVADVQGSEPVVHGSWLARGIPAVLLGRVSNGISAGTSQLRTRVHTPHLRIRRQSPGLRVPPSDGWLLVAPRR